MSKPFLLSAACYFIAIGSNANAAPRLSPPMPSLDSFSNCRDIKHPDFESTTRCAQLGKQNVMREFGVPVDGNPRMRHMAFLLDTFRIRDVDATLYSLRQAAYDCAANRGVERTVYSFVVWPGFPQKMLPAELQKWESIEGNYKAVADSWCPERAGYLRINKSQYAINSAIRRGSRVNVNAIGESGYKFVFVVECSTMMYGINKKPDRPISPGSVGHEIYKRVCK